MTCDGFLLSPSLIASRCAVAAATAAAAVEDEHIGMAGDLKGGEGLAQGTMGIGTSAIEGDEALSPDVGSGGNGGSAATDGNAEGAVLGLPMAAQLYSAPMGEEELGPGRATTKWVVWDVRVTRTRPTLAKRVGMWD